MVKSDFPFNPCLFGGWGGYHNYAECSHLQFMPTGYHTLTSYHTLAGINHPQPERITFSLKIMTITSLLLLKPLMPSFFITPG